MARMSTAFFLAISCITAGTVHAEDPGMKCKIGPAPVRLSNAIWNAYGCDDGASLVFVSTPQSAAHPFYFLVIRPLADEQMIQGEGNGKKSATKPAYDALVKMTKQDFDAIYAKALHKK